MYKSINDQKLDQLFKQTLSNKVFLAMIMKECIEAYKNESIETIINEYIESHISISSKRVHPRIVGVNTEINDDNKKTTYDINFCASLPKSKNKIDVIINIEAQNAYYPGYHMMNRAHYYNARNISSQFGVFFSESNYDELRKVVSIWLILAPPKQMMNSINCYKMQENQIYGSAHEKEEYINKNEIIMVYCSKESESDFIQLINDLRDRNINIQSLKDQMKNKYGYDLDEKCESEVVNMCNFSQYVREESKKETILENLKSLMVNLNLSLKEAMDALGLSEEEQLNFKTLLQ